MSQAMLDPARELVLLLEEAEARIAALERQQREPIAVIGMGCRFPGAANPDAFWRLILEGRDAIGRVPPDRWDADAWYDPDPAALGRMYTKEGGFIDQIDRFDARYFGISPREAESLDPQHRLFLEVAVEALDDAGLPQERLAGSDTGVYLGIGSGDYLRILGDLTRREPYYGPGNAFSAAAGRLSYWLGLHGPCMAVDTACSSSLVAVHLAMQALRARTCTAALAGGVNLILSPETTLYFCRMGGMARDGRCKTFDARADGYVRGEGCGVVVLKRLSDAVTAGDTILAVLRGSAVNQDGRSNGLTVPNGKAQEAVTAKALADAGVTPAEISYVEAHGTGTSLGDPIEVNALAHVLRPAELRDLPLTLGAVKTNIGHLESAAGIAGLIKTILMLRHRVIPPVVNFSTPNPEIDWNAADLRVPAKSLAWTAERPVAGISAFGFAGTNAHVVLEAAPPLQPSLRKASTSTSLLLPVSARSGPALRDLALACRDSLVTATDAALFCRSTARRRSHLPHRLAVTGADAEALIDALSAFADNDSVPAQLHVSPGAVARPRIAFVFPGQGGQWPGMARDLLDTPAFRDALSAAGLAMAHDLGVSVLDLIRDGHAIDRVEHVQPALFAVQVALAALWRSWGVAPDMVAGHSMGEVAAAHVAGILSLADAARVIVRRSQLLSGIAGRGAMLLAELTRDAAERHAARFAGRLSIAVCNSRRSTVLSGDAAAVDALLTELEAEGVFARRVKVDVASHSPQVDPLLPVLRADLADIAPGDGVVTMISSVTAEPVAGVSLDADYWCDNLRRPVLFGAAVEAMLARGATVFLELGPHPVLAPAIEETERSASQGAWRAPVAACLRRDVPSATPLAEVAAVLYAAGAMLDWDALMPGHVSPAGSPAYPWQRERYWVAEPETAPAPPLPRPSSESRDSGIGGYYDRGAAYHQAREASGGTASGDVISGYLTWALLAERVAGFSWLLTVFRPEHDLLHQALLAAGQRELRRLLFQDIDLAAVRRIFDFGCGYGSDLIDLASANPGLVAEGYTLSARQADIGNDRAARMGLGERVRIYQRDSAGSHWPGVYDVVFGFEVSGLIADKDALFDNIAGSLAPGGRLILAEVLASGASSVDLPELSTYSASAEQFAELLARRRLRLISSIDVSPPIANCLYDPAFDANLSSLAAQDSIDPLLLQHVAMYPNVGRALEAGLLVYMLMSAVKDPFASVTDVLAHNRALLARPASYRDVTTRLVARTAGLADWLWRIDWRAAPLPAGSAAPRAWLLVGGGDGIRTALAEALTATGVRVQMAAHSEHLDLSARGTWTVRPDCPDDYAALVSAANLGRAPDAVVYLAQDEPRQQGVIAALHLVQALAQVNLPEAPRLWFVTASVQCLGGDTASNPLSAPVWGLGRTVMHEHPEFNLGLVDLPAQTTPADIAALTRALTVNGPESQIAIRHGASFVARLVPAGDALIGTEPPPLRADATYLITGGLGGLGLAVAERFAAAGAGSLALTARRPADARAAAALEAIKAHGTQVAVRQVDVADRAAMRDLLQSIDTAERPLRGIIHAAGGLDDGILLKQTAQRFEVLLAAKQQGAMILEEESADRALDFFVMFSGLASVFGSPGQGNYAAANAALDAIARDRQARGLPGLSIGWAPWAEIGLVASWEMSASGVDTLPTATGLDILMRCLGARSAELAVMSFDPDRWLRSYPVLAASPLLSDLAPAATASHAPAPAPATTRNDGQSLRAALLAEPPGWPRRTRLERHVAAVLAGVLRLPPEAVERGAALKDLGFDSLMALEARNRLESDTGLKLQVTLIWKHPTLADLAEHLAERIQVPLDTVQRPSPVPPAAGNQPEDDGTLVDLLSAIEGLSDDEARHRYQAGN
jgi:acyl transferase domain-containing protein/SAM-dependent methyltransferase/acyl carrier protein